MSNPEELPDPLYRGGVEHHPPAMKNYRLAADQAAPAMKIGAPPLAGAM
jgi:hypothetical protein